MVSNVRGLRHDLLGVPEDLTPGVADCLLEASSARTCVDIVQAWLLGEL